MQKSDKKVCKFIFIYYLCINETKTTKKHKAMATLNYNFINATARNIYTIIREDWRIPASWGAREYRATAYNGSYEGMAALRFRVSGFIHKGLVVVAYNEGTDLFDVYLTTLAGKVKKAITDVYADILTRTIDREVETKNDQSAEYGAKVDAFLSRV